MDSVRVASRSAIADYVPYILGVSVCYLAIKRLFAVPKELQHIPAVPVLPTLISFARGEVEDVRIKRLLLPYAQKGEPAVLMYALGRWIIHVLDSKVRQRPFLRVSVNPLMQTPDCQKHVCGSSDVSQGSPTGWSSSLAVRRVQKCHLV